MLVTPHGEAHYTREPATQDAPIFFELERLKVPSRVSRSPGLPADRCPHMTAAIRHRTRHTH